jgi:hypothetical protein
MEQHHEKTESSSKKIGILSAISFFLAGILLSSMIFSISLKILASVWGAFLGSAINITAAGYILNKWKNNQRLRIVGYGIVITLILFVVLSIGLWTLFLNLFQEIAN